MQSSWASELARFASDCETAPAGQAGQMVVRLYDLLADNSRTQLLDGIAREDIVRRCEADCADAAALVLMGNCGIMLSRAPDSMAIATVVPAGLDAEFTANSRSIALALCEALAGALSEAIPTEAEVRSAPLFQGRS